MGDDDRPLGWRAFHLPKRGHSEAEYEDAFAGDGRAGRFALADGASESSFAAAWARLLVEGFVRGPGKWPAWLPPLRQRWAATGCAGALPWYAEAKFEQGAFATLLGVALGPRRRRWRAYAVGDSCVFHVRGGRLLRAFPRTCSAEFDNSPRLVGSRPLPGGTPPRERTSGPWRPSDRLLLMTDALAQWFLRRVEAGRRPWKALERLRTDEDFARWVERLRDREELRNDDVTLLAVRSCDPDGGMGEPPGQTGTQVPG
jgi:Protein phosphatase 2C